MQPYNISMCLSISASYCILSVCLPDARVVVMVPQHAKKEVSELRSKLDMAIKAKANALAMAGKAVAETETLRAMIKKSAEQRRAAAKHARSMEVELDAERAELQRKAEEMGRQQAALQVRGYIPPNSAYSDAICRGYWSRLLLQASISPHGLDG